MIIKKIELKNFRNYSSASFIPDPGINMLIGENAQGKTNLVESIFLCCVGRSHRTHNDEDLIRFDTQAAFVKTSVQTRQGSKDIEVLLRRGEKKAIRVNGNPISRMSELVGHLSTVLFSPEDLLLVKEGPSRRRKFLDIALCQMDPSYFNVLQSYNRALFQRNKLLKGDCDDKHLKAWDTQLSQYGEKIINKRSEFIGALKKECVPIHFHVSSEKEKLNIEYAPSIEGDAEKIEAVLAQNTSIDIKRGNTCLGPHRDDINITINSNDTRVFASQGQQRTAALSLKLAELRVMEEAIGEAPVLMLDDVFSELDESRQKQLLYEISKVQVFLTCTNSMSLGNVAGSKFNISCGKIIGF